MKHLFKESSLTLAAMSLGYGVVQLDVTIVNVAVSAIGASFHGNMAALQWVVSSYTIKIGRASCRERVCMLV